MMSKHCIGYCIIVIWCISLVAADFDADRCKLIDQTSPGALASNVTNYLFRGSLPLDNGDFAWSEMNDTFHEVVPDMPNDYILIDLSLLNDFEPIENEEEKSFFRKNPELGSYVNWPIWGNVMIPDAIPESKRTQMAIDLPNWQHDQLPEKIPELRDMLYTDYNITTVIYVHCDAGMDRTGEVSGSYYIRYLGWSFHEALYYDDNAIEGKDGRNIHVASRNGLQWYCYYLDDTSQITNNCTLPAFDNCGYDPNRCDNYEFKEFN